MEEDEEDAEDAEGGGEEEEFEVDGVEDEEEGDSNINLESNTSFDAIQAIIKREGLDVLFPPLDGTAFYFNICKINHSCSPNMYVRYATFETAGLCAEAVAIRNIEAGEELLQSYIDQSLGSRKSLPLPFSALFLAQFLLFR